MTKFWALHRMVEAYYEMGMIQESIEIAAVLGHNYPDTKWYRYSYNLVKIKNNNSILDKLTKIFQLMDKKKNEKLVKKRLKELSKFKNIITSTII